MTHTVFALFVAACTALLVHVPSGQAWPESCGDYKIHNFSWGTKGYFDKLYYTIQEVKTRSLLRKLSYDITIPPRGTPQKGLISYIEVLDQYSDGNGACAYLNGGGVGYANVTLHVKSQRNQGVNFIINVYGK